MTSFKGYVLVEGHGEVDGAANNLIARLSRDVQTPFSWSPARRWTNLHLWDGVRRGGLRSGAEFIRSKGDASALLILRDEDDGCPRELAPARAEQLRSLHLPFPTAYVLLHPEFEVLFLPCLDRMSGAGFPAGLVWDRDSWEARRGMKEWLSAQLPRGRRYKPTTDQLSLTRCLDLNALRAAEVPCFGTLERAVRFLGARSHARTAGGEVYPPLS